MKSDPCSCVPLLSRLREATRPMHDRLEHNHRMAQLLSPDLTLDQYGEVLQRFHALIDPFENHLCNYGSDWDRLGYPALNRTKTSRLLRDLDWLGIQPLSTAEIPDDAVLACHCFPALIGSLYVIEGSSMGGRVITRHLQKHLNIQPDSGGAYFFGDGPQAHPHWRTFQNMLENYSSLDYDTDATVAAACDAFSTFDRMLQ